MTRPSRKTLLFTLALVGALGWLAWAVQQQLRETAGSQGRDGDQRPIPVEVAPIVHGPIEKRRTFTGTLEAQAEFVVAPKVSGRIEDIGLDLADAVKRGQVVAMLDDAEYVQDVARAEADLAVTRASHLEAESLLKIAERELERVEKLQTRGLSSDSQLDTSRAEQLAKRALVSVTEARVASAQADLEAARIRLGYTQVTADWRGGSERRMVAERYVDEGETVTANTALLRIVELDPITAVFSVTERDYAELRTGMAALISTDAFPGESFEGRIQRIAPVFRESTRQARVEIGVENPDRRLKPGMFARATLILDRHEDATIVPEQALTKRDAGEGIFVIASESSQALWRPVRSGIQEEDRLEVIGDGLEGRVVTLGQQQLRDGARVRVVEPETAP
ncbi:efflux RND transporter periplasmic adaptor subunit [Imhoffiella purpurea]|uniref:Efflux transporter, RND family, MFP subunit n=1 Tax=Imhoffiella purpurea TaxID=1249627 RepID=W9VLM2_9GAMM|nr:efflux RND transporter periplasmic adaptor subunit [Imhoffiella purpurea]EXJ17002.1 efflux transporter, RND family, MFP subunit [Imhoffiella purpurea]